MTTTTIRPYVSRYHPRHCIVVEHDTPHGTLTIFAHKDAIGYRTAEQGIGWDVMTGAGFIRDRDGRWRMPRHMLPEGLR